MWTIITAALSYHKEAFKLVLAAADTKGLGTTKLLAPSDKDLVRRSRDVKPCTLGLQQRTPQFKPRLFFTRKTVSSEEDREGMSSYYVCL